MTSTGERMVDGSSPTLNKLFFFCTFNHNINIIVDPPPPTTAGLFFFFFFFRVTADALIMSFCCVPGAVMAPIYICVDFCRMRTPLRGPVLRWLAATLLSCWSCVCVGTGGLFDIMTVEPGFCFERECAR